VPRSRRSTPSGRRRASWPPRARRWPTAPTSPKWGTSSPSCRWRVWRPLLARRLPTSTPWRWTPSVSSRRATPRSTRPSRSVLRGTGPAAATVTPSLFHHRFLKSNSGDRFFKADDAHPGGPSEHRAAVPDGGQDALHPGLAVASGVRHQLLHRQVQEEILCILWKVKFFFFFTLYLDFCFCFTEQKNVTKHRKWQQQKGRVKELKVENIYWEVDCG